MTGMNFCSFCVIFCVFHDAHTHFWSKEKSDVFFVKISSFLENKFLRFLLSYDCAFRTFCDETHETKKDRQKIRHFLNTFKNGGIRMSDNTWEKGVSAVLQEVCVRVVGKKRIWDELRVEKPLMEKNNWGTCVQILSLLRSQSQIFFFVSRKTCSFFVVFVIQMIIFFRRLLQFGFCSTPTWDTQVWQGLHRKPVRVVWRHGLERGLLAFF